MEVLSHEMLSKNKSKAAGLENMMSLQILGKDGEKC